MARNKQSLSISTAEWMRERENGDMAFLCKRVTTLFTIQGFAVNTETVNNGVSLTTQITVEKDGVTANLHVSLEKGNVFLKTEYGNVVGKFKFTPTVVTSTVGMLFAEWCQCCEERIG